METLDYITRQNFRYSQFHEVRNLFFESLSAAEQHWFFVQGHDAYVQELYVPALSSLLNGIEASLRVTLHLLGKDKEKDIRDLSPYRVLSNKLILQAQEAEMPVKYLAFNDETDFYDRLKSEKPNKVDVGSPWRRPFRAEIKTDPLPSFLMACMVVYSGGISRPAVRLICARFISVFESALRFP